MSSYSSGLIVTSVRYDLTFGRIRDLGMCVYGLGLLGEILFEKRRCLDGERSLDTESTGVRDFGQP